MSKQQKDKNDLENVSGGADLLNIDIENTEEDNHKLLTIKGSGNTLNFLKPQENDQKKKMNNLIENFERDGSMTTVKKQ